MAAREVDERTSSHMSSGDSETEIVPAVSRSVIVEPVRDGTIETISTTDTITVRVRLVLDSLTRIGFGGK